MMDIDEIINDIILQIENSLSDNLPLLYYDDDSIGIYEYWGFIMVDPPKPYIEIDESEREIIIKNVYPLQLLLDALDFFNNRTSENHYSWHSYIIDDKNQKYNYHIKNCIILNDIIIITIEWDEFYENNRV